MTRRSRPSELLAEGLVRVDAIRKACLTNLDCARDCLVTEVEHPIDERPVCNLVVGRGMQAIAATIESHKGAFSLISETVDIASGSAATLRLEAR
jgi:hypothetical protein